MESMVGIWRTKIKVYLIKVGDSTKLAYTLQARGSGFGHLQVRLTFAHKHRLLLAQ
jgi:hypothetical protein